MREDYSAYKSRVLELVQNRACFPVVGKTFCTAPALKAKFDEGGAFRPFYGDTTVFPLPPEVICSLAKLQEKLYRCTEYMLSAQLPPSTFHITLHDLNAGEIKEELAPSIAENTHRVVKLLHTIRLKGVVKLRSVGIVSMVSSSLVMLFEPATEVDHNIVQEIYHIIDPLKELSYPLTLHCTLAYYKPGIYSYEQWNPLFNEVTELNCQEPLEIALNCAALEYQHFASMKNYFKAE
ncbi:MAG: hypothetical protein ACI38Q_08155 [Candidatus Bruticola sp.]